MEGNPLGMPGGIGWLTEDTENRTGAEEEWNSSSIDIEYMRRDFTPRRPSLQWCSSLLSCVDSQIYK